MDSEATLKETIVAAAVRIPVPERWTKEIWGGERSYPDYLIISSPPPARHGTLLHPMYDYMGKPIGPDDQGFLTSTGRYVDRKEALAIVFAAGQPRIDHPSRNDHDLYSEDLW